MAALKAVITGDIVNSTKLTLIKERKLVKCLHQVLAPYQYEFYRGDSFQAYLTEPVQAMKIALQCRTAAMQMAKNDDVIESDVRLSIGIGQIKGRVISLATAKGEAFVLSGRALDDITKNGERLCIQTIHPLANEGLQVIADYTNSIFKVMTGKQAAVVFELLKGQLQQVVAVKLKKSKSTIHQHVTAGRWPEIERLLHQYENIINQLP